MFLIELRAIGSHPFLSGTDTGLKSSNSLQTKIDVLVREVRVICDGEPIKQHNVSLAACFAG